MTLALVNYTGTDTLADVKQRGCEHVVIAERKEEEEEKEDSLYWLIAQVCAPRYLPTQHQQLYSWSWVLDVLVDTHVALAVSASSMLKERAATACAFLYVGRLKHMRMLSLVRITYLVYQATVK